MKSISELTDFYYSNLYDTVKDLDKKRLRVKKHLIIYVIVIAVVVTTLLYYGVDPVFVVFGAITFFGFGYSLIAKDYVDEFKVKVIKNS